MPTVKYASGPGESTIVECDRVDIRSDGFVAIQPDGEDHPRLIEQSSVYYIDGWSQPGRMF